MGNVVQRVLVTGATGFLGGHLIHYLSAKGLSVVAIGRDGEKCDGLKARGFQTIRHDLTLPVPEGVGANIDAVIHCAALSAATGPRIAFERANVLATQNIINMAKKHGIKRFVLISSPTVYFKMADNLLVKEDAKLPKPINHYAMTKRAAEVLVLGEDEIGPIVLRPRGIYGPGDETLLPSLLEAARRPLPRLRADNASIDLTFVDDVVKAIFAALMAGSEVNGEVFNISGGEGLRIKHIVEKTCHAYGNQVRWRSMPLAPLVIGARVLEGLADNLPFVPHPKITPYLLGLFAFAQSLDISKANRVLNWQPTVSFDEGLRRTLEAERLA